MSTIARPDLPNAEIGEVIEHLMYAHGWDMTRFTVWRDDEGVLQIQADEDAYTIEAALADYTPAAAPGTWRPREIPLRPEIGQHVSHVRDYFKAQRDGTQAAKTGAVRLSEAEHVIADLALIMRELYGRLALE